MWYDWILGIGIAFGLAFLFSYITKYDFDGFSVFLMIFIGFVVYVGLLPLWSLVFDLIIVVILIYVNLIRGKT